MALTAEQIAASTYFDADAYVEAKARIMVLNGKANSQEDAKAQFLSNWTGDMSEHYLNYGAAENVNPSNDFDNSDYIAQVADADGVTYQALKADWEAQGIAPLEHFIETGEGLGYTAPAVSADEQVDVGDTPVVEGDDIRLTSDTDRDGIFDGTSGDDAFDAPIVQNSLAGGVSNSLSTADDIDGGAGSDSLYAELVPEFYGVSGDNTMEIQPDIQSVEDIRFEAMDVAPFVAITVDAKDITDVDTIGSAYSDADLVIENLTTLTSAGVARNTDEITITMDHTDNFNTDGDASDLSVYFDEDYLLNDEDTSGGQLEIRLLNAVQNEAGNNPVEGFSEITFTVGGTEVSVDITSIAADSTLDYTTAYGEIVDAINAQLNADGFNTVTAAPGPIEHAVFSIPVAGFSTGDDAGDYYPIVVTNTGSEELAGVDIETSALSYDTDLNNSFAATDPETTENPVSVNVELEKVGRDGEGGDLVIGGKDDDSLAVNTDTDVDQVDGIELFDITVLGGEDKPSNLGVISSTNNYLDTVNIASAEPGQDDDGEDTWADLTVRERLGEGQELTLIDSTDFNGDFALGMSIVDVNGVPTTIVTGVQQALTSNFGSGNDSYNWQSVEDDGVSSDKDYSISMGNGNDTVAVNLDGDSVDAFGETFKVSTGSGDDTVNITMTDGVSQSTMADLHNNSDLHDKPEDYLEIETGAGDDTVNLAAYGNFNIETGTGSDFVQINSIVGNGNGNASTGTWVIGPATSSADTFGDRVLYKAQLTVSFAGFESTVAVDTDSQGNFVADQMTINEAIIAAIENEDVPELDTLLDYQLGTDSQQITITSLVGGENSLAIALYQPEVVASGTDDVQAGQVEVSSGDVTALRQGLIDTTADTSADLAEEINIIAAIDNGSIDQAGAGDGVTYAYIENDTVLDGVDDNNTATGDQDIFDLADVDLYLDYANGGSSDSTTGVNFSTIDVGDGSNDIVVMHSNHDASSNVLKISEGFGKVSVVNFHTEPTDAVGSYLDVSDHALDFTTYLTNQDDPSDDPANNTQSVVPVPVTLNIVDDAEAFTDSAANPDATNTNDAVANGVNVLRFDENVDDPDDLQTFEDLTADILLAALNDDDADSTYGNLDQGLLTPDDFGGDDLQSTTQQHIVMVENDQNEGEYKVFYLTSSVDGDGNVDDESEDGVNQFANAEELGTLDFGASINFNLVGSDEYTELRDEWLAAADGVVVDDDTTAPTLVSSTPADDATDIAVADDIVLTFDEAVVAGPGEIALFDAADPNTVLDSTATFGVNTVTINPNADLAEGTEYFVRVLATAVEDAAGNAFAGFTDPTTLNFTTETTGGDTTAPTLVSSTPADDATDIAVADDIVLTFDEAVVAGPGEIALFDAADPNTVLDSTATFGVNTVTINPNADLAEGTEYFVRVLATAVEDAAGNAFAGFTDPTTLNFTTAAAATGYTEESADIGTATVAGTLDAVSDSFKFTDDATVLNNVVIDNFTANDVIEVTNALETDYSFSNNGADVTMSFNNAGTLNQIVLSGVVSATDLVYDQASFEAAIGFDAFTVA